jgi:hypothetical protein
VSRTHWSPQADEEKPQFRVTTPKLQDEIAARINLSDGECRKFDEVIIEYRDIFAMENDNYRRINRV